MEDTMEKVEIDGKIYELSNLSDAAKAQVASLYFVNEQILQKNNELQIAETAKIGYSRALNRELKKIGANE